MVTRYFPSNLPIDPIPQQSETVYGDYLKIKGFEDVGYFLIAYVVAGGLATLNITRNDTIDVNDTVVSLNNDVMFRAGTSFSVTTMNATYYLDFTKEGDFSWSTSHPTGTADTDYLTLATITTDADGNVDVITDTRGTVGGLQLKPDSGWVTSEELDNLAGSGRTTETVKGNSDDIAEVAEDLAAHEAEFATHITTEASDTILGHVLAKHNAAISLSELPTNAYGTYAWNGAAFIQDNVTSYNGKQYTVFVGVNKRPTIASRMLPNGEWSTFDLSTITDDPLVSPAADDGHNVFCLAVDSDGYIHISGNMHGNVLRYAKSTNPEDITAWATAAMSGDDEDKVTYPQFVKMRDGKLLFFYRNGLSGSADTFINEYDTATKTWSKVQAKFIDGLTSSESAYLNHIAVDSDDTIHIMWVWRGSGAANTNNDICYAKSDDGGVTWKKASGIAYTLPITHATAEVVVATAATDSGLLNQNGLEVDKEGRPHGAFLLYDSDGYTQINHVWYDGTVWHTDVVTNFSYTYITAVSIPDLSVARPSVFTTANGRVYIIYRHRFNGHRDTIRCIDVTPGVTFYDDFPIMQLDLGDWEPTFDTQALYDLNELHMVILPMKNNGSSSAEWNNADNWNSQYLAVISYDLDQIDAVQRGEVKLPAIRSLSNMIAALSTPLSITATTKTALVIPGALITKNEQRQLFARSKARANLVSGATNMDICIRETLESGDTGGDYGTFSVTTQASNSYFETPWIKTKATENSFGFLIAAGSVDAGSGKLTLFEVELGYLDF